MQWATQTTNLHVKTPLASFALRIFNNRLCRDVSQSIIEGKTYARVDFVRNVQVVLDVGANVGAASVYFALQYPTARIFALEPGPDALELLKNNAASFANIQVLPLGLYDRDCQRPLYMSKEDAVTNSIGASYLNSKHAVPIELRDALGFCRERGIEAIDILKVDTEGCELPILRSLAGMLARIKVIYLEYHDETDRLAIDGLLTPTHILMAAKVRHPHRGELCYVAYDAFPSRPALDKLRIANPSPESRPVEVCTWAPAAEQHQVAVVTPTVLRHSLLKAAQSVFAQQIDGRGQWLIGVDQPLGERTILSEIQAIKPANWDVLVFDPGYSTSVRRGGLHPAKDGGALRTILSYMANSRFVAYLDDDNWWSADHLPSLLTAIRGHEWAYSRRWFVDAESLQPLCEDQWESVGPGKGVFAEFRGGFVDPNTLLLDKLACEPVLRWWSIPLQNCPKGMSADRNVFDMLMQFLGSATGKASCFYRLDPNQDDKPKDGQEAGLPPVPEKRD